MAVDLALDASFEDLAVAGAEAVVAACYIRLGRGSKHVAALCRTWRVFGDQDGLRRRQRSGEDQEVGKTSTHIAGCSRLSFGAMSAARRRRVKIYK